MGTVEVRDGRPVLVRHGADDLRAEAAVLAAIAGPGVPEVLELSDDGGAVRLVASVARPLVWRGLRTRDIAAVAAAVATVLARAHAAGVVHGPLRDDQLLGAPGAVVLGGWETAGTGDPADDVAELGRLLERLAPADGVLRSIAARAAAPGRPTMAALAESLRAVALRPPARVAGRADRRWMVGAGAAATLVLASVAGAALPARRSSAAPAATTTTTTTTGLAPTVAGNTVVRDGARWTVGRRGDLVVIGDWGCDGVATPGVVRLSSGMVWEFARWPADGAPAAGRAVGTVAGAVSARVERSGGCDHLVVVDGQGRATTLG